jgi:hypothetical protein
MKLSPKQIEIQRVKETTQRLSLQKKIPDININSIQNATTSILKPTGSAKLSIIITDLGKKIYTLLLPIAVNLATELGTKLAQSELSKLKQQFSPKDGCPNNSTLKNLINQRNALVEQLNNIGKQLDILTKAVTSLSSFLTISGVIISALKITKSTISIAAKVIPAPPGLPGVVTSSLSDLEDTINKLLFDDLGQPRLPKIAGSVASSALSISIINGYIQQIIAILKSIDLKLQQCNPDLTNGSSIGITNQNERTNIGPVPTLTPINPDLLQIATLQIQAEQTQNQVTYKGFVIEIETVPYSPTVNRHKAVGKNQSGIILIETELSFTTEFQLLINELKLIIDIKNLKAY